VQDTLASSFKAAAPSEVYDQLDTLLSKLEDPFTRLLRQDDTAAFVAQEEGKVGGPQCQMLHTSSHTCPCMAPGAALLPLLTSCLLCHPSVMLRCFCLAGAVNGTGPAA
jgi:hypothetical protein